MEQRCMESNNINFTTKKSKVLRLLQKLKLYFCIKWKFAYIAWNKLTGGLVIIMILMPDFSAILLYGKLHGRHSSSNIQDNGQKRK